MGDKRVAIVADAGFYVGPALSRLLAERGHDLVLGDPGPLAAELTGAGVEVEAVEGVRDLAAWGFRACAHMSAIRPNRPERVWAVIGETFRALRERDNRPGSP